jgi:hypothetical protein
MKQDIGNLKISVHSIHFVESPETIEDLFEEISGLILSETLFGIKILLKITAIAILHCDELSAVRGKRFYESNDVLVFAFL